MLVVDGEIVEDTGLEFGRAAMGAPADLHLGEVREEALVRPPSSDAA